MKWRCDYGHLDELKNIPRRSFPPSDPLMIILDLRSASLDHAVLFVIQLVTMLTSSAGF